ncbi:kynurenine aminotransferase [Amyelois transitella]|uniref:kynurenine aminotransferase n=1 Tax=Amyelois transitella TaxID=680683 RepID=UPI00067D6443|nr:kynurenine aminotransferase [Amyelois transitella]XP_013183311.1 kynurenine aminotransferase [Amyelois transitella]XP_060810549.1 kynurenine aminotransferase [Amyelois transitella]
MSDKFRLPPRYGTGEKSVWVEYIQLVAEVKPKLNLGQGFPDFPAPSHVPKALAEVTTSDDPLLNQYTRGFGHPRLVQNLSKLYSPLIGRQIDPMNEILVTAGAYGALYSAILGHVEDGDEVIVIEPFFDCYEAMIKCAGGVPKFIALKPNKIHEDMTAADWVLDYKELESLFSDRTKMFILNTPHNPLGKVFTRQELEKIADLCKKYNVLCLSDEVYEWMVFEPFQHIRIATLPDMWERTITIGSAGKTFSVTGWKVGWAYGPANLLRNLQVVHQNCIYTHCTPVQEAIARSLEFEMARWKTPECYMFSIAKELTSKRDMLNRILKDNGFITTPPDGGYFILADWTKLGNKLDLSTEKDEFKDYRFTKKFAKEAGILAIPMSAFYSKEHKNLGENYARFCFIKKDENLALAEKLLQEWKRR